MSVRRAAVITVVAALVPSVALACMWDYDTLKMERQRFPSALELITGKFLRHSPEFYEWRVRDRTARLQADPANLALHDDLAVAFDKLGQHEKAIDTMRSADKLRPGRYETQSNLATFLFHAGRLEESLERVEAALAINPDAHFGREKYQKYLTQFVMPRRVDGKITLPLASVELFGEPSNTFAKFLVFHPDGASEREIRRTPNPDAIKGVLGMMRFANHDSPVLLEALASLLAGDVVLYDDGKRLAARGYLKASYEVKGDHQRDAYRALATSVLSMQTRNPDTQDRLSLAELEADFKKELADAKAWYAELREKELGWIRDGKNADEEFDTLYDREPEQSDVEPAINVERGVTIAAVVAVAIGVVCVVVALLIRSRRAVRSNWPRAR